MTWTPLLALALLSVVFALGDYVAKKTKGLISSLVVASVIYLIGFLSGILPADSIDSTGLTDLMYTVGIGLIITSLGTSIRLNDFVREWKTVLIALVGLLGLALVSFLIAPPLFGKDFALSAACPISGGAIAAIIAQSAVLDAGRTDLGAYVMLLLALQQLVGIPVASAILRKRLQTMSAKGMFVNTEALAAAAGVETAAPQKKLPLAFAPKDAGSNFYIAKLAIVAAVAGVVASWTVIPNSNPTNYVLNPNVAYLLFGLVFAHFGFLDRDLTSKSQSYGLLMLAVCALVPAALNVSLQELASLIVPIIGMLLLGAVGLGLGGLLCGKILRVDGWVSFALGLCAMIGYPATQIISVEIAEGLNVEEQQKKAALDYLMPKMLLAGFTSVTIASVIFASIVSQFIFK